MGSPLLPLLLIAALNRAADACSCIHFDANETFSMVDFVSRVLVEKEELKCDPEVADGGSSAISDDSDVFTTTGSSCGEWNAAERVYTVKHLEVYKAPNVTLPNTIHTDAQGAACGAQMMTGSEYVVSGSASGSHLSISLCLYRNINRQQAEILRAGN